ncbi:MAG: hypothetical protein ACOC33_01090 [bacterium]
MTRDRIDRAIDVIKYAIKNNISLAEASRRSGFSETYVKNVKSQLFEKHEIGIVDDNDFSDFMDIYDEYRNNNVSTKTNTNTTNQQTPPPLNNDQIKYNENGNEASIDSRQVIDVDNHPHITTLDELLDVCNVDKDVWKVKNHTINKWDVTSWKNGQPERAQNFQVKANLERVDELFKFKYSAELFLEMIDGYKPPQLTISPKFNNEIPLDIQKENNIFEICIFDLHIGKLAWHGETGEDYDSKIASRRFNEALQKLLYRSSSFNYDRILFPIGNDFFNSDTILNTTTKGTHQDEDLRWQKTFKVGCKLIVDGINLLKQTGKEIDVLVIPGNHDFERSYYMGSFLEAWFNSDSQVNINNSASPRKYYVFGDVLLGYTHGGEEKESSLPLLMASDKESKPYWSETKYHEWHLGHFHRKIQTNYVVLDKGKSLAEDLGVTVRYLSSLSGTEEWHHKKGFVGTIKAADGFIWNDKNGLIAHINSNITE